jgi:hypothetical protein
LIQYFKPASVFINGYDFEEDELGLHTVRLRYEGGDPHICDQLTEKVDDILSGVTTLPECAPPAIDISRSSRYKHPYEIFDLFRRPDF